MLIYIDCVVEERLVLWKRLHSIYMLPYDAILRLVDLPAQRQALRTAAFLP